MCNLIHVANVLYCISYAVRSIFWLRVLTVIAASMLIPYFYIQPEPLYAPICWNLLFIGLNLFQIGWLLWEQRPIKLTEDQQKLYDLIFHVISPREMLRLLNLAHWSEAEPGETVIQQNTEIDDLMLLFEGKVNVSNGQSHFAEVGEGEFLGEMSFLTHGKTTANVSAKTRIRYLTWARSELRPYLANNPEMQTAMYSLIGINLVEKLSDMQKPHSNT